MKKLKQIMMVCLAIAMCCLMTGSTVLAADVKVGNGLYTRTKGKIGKEKTTIYRQKTNGKKEKLTTVSGSVSGHVYIYDNKLFYTRSYGDYAPRNVVIECKNLKTKRKSKITEDMELVAHSGRRLLAMPVETWPIQPLYVIDTKNKKRILISNNVSTGGACFSQSGRIYYIRFVNKHYGAGITKYTVYSCRKDGTGKKKVKSFSSDRNTVKKITGKYVILGGYNKKDKKYFY